MPPDALQRSSARTSWLVVHPASPEDSVAAAALRSVVAPMKGKLDDSRRYVERATAAGVDAKLDLWMGMPHGFVTNVGGFKAAAQAVKESGAFLSEVISGNALSGNSADVAKGDGD